MALAERPPDDSDDDSELDAYDVLEDVGALDGEQPQEDVGDANELGDQPVPPELFQQVCTHGTMPSKSPGS